MPEIGRNSFPGIRITDDGKVEIVGHSLSTGYVFESRVSGDSVARFAITAGGSLEWGGGAGARDTSLFRQSAGIVRAGNHFYASGALYSAYNAASGTIGLRSIISGQAFESLHILNTGEIKLGSGAAAFDVLLTRSGANAYNINVNSIDGLRISNTAVAGDTFLMVYDVDNATLERVTVGAADSGGAGFKVLRIPN